MHAMHLTARAYDQLERQVSASLDLLQCFALQFYVQGEGHKHQTGATDAGPDLRGSLRSGWMMILICMPRTRQPEPLIS